MPGGTTEMRSARSLSRSTMSTLADSESVTIGVRR